MLRAMKRIVTLVVGAVLLQAASVSPAQQRPAGRQARVVLLVDSSVAMSQMVPQFREGLNIFFDELPEAEIVMMSFGAQGRVRAGPTLDRTELVNAANRFTSDGGGNVLLDALLEADRRFLRNVPDRRSLVVIVTTDADSAVREARADLYNRFLEQFLDRGGRAHGIVLQGSSIGIARHVVENLTKNTGGFYETILVPTALPRLMSTLAAYVAADL
jgi:hypothetical protein